MFISALSVAILLASCNGSSRSASKNEAATSSPMDSVSRKLEKTAIENELSGLSVRLISRGERVVDFQWGMADRERSIPITDQTTYRIASISKTFTALALMQLYEQNLVDLNADVSTYLGWELRNPSFPDQPITLKMLMSHQSSARDGEGYSRFSADMFSKNISIKELFTPGGEYYSADMFAAHEPGDFFSYTNCTWGIIASVIETISGTTLENYSRTNIFLPMEMDAAFDPSNLDDPDELAVIYRYNDGLWLPQADNLKGSKPAPKTDSTYMPGSNGLIYGPQGGLRCSLNDLEKLARLFWNKGNFDSRKIVKEETLELMTSDQWTYNGENGDTWDGFFNSYGLGVHRITNTPEKDMIFPEMKMTGHPGIAYGLLSDLYFNAETETAVIFVTNGSKKEYSYGKNTTFYQPEEDVFRILSPFVKSEK